MKKNILISTIVLTLASASVFAQGTVVFNNDGSTRVTLIGWGADAYSVPWGTPIPKGSEATGDPFKASLYYAAGPASTYPYQDSFSRAATVNFSRFAAGTFVGGNVTLTGVPENGSVWLQVRVWETAYGNTYEEAIMAPSQNGRPALLGASTVWNMTAGNALSTPSIVQGGFTGFTVGVPEPSTIALGLLGLAGLVIFRRRQ